MFYFVQYQRPIFLYWGKEYTGTKQHRITAIDVIWRQNTQNFHICIYFLSVNKDIGTLHWYNCFVILGICKLSNLNYIHYIGMKNVELFILCYIISAVPGSTLFNEKKQAIWTINFSSTENWIPLRLPSYVKCMIMKIRMKHLNWNWSVPWRQAAA